MTSVPLNSKKLNCYHPMAFLCQALSKLLCGECDIIFDSRGLEDLTTPLLLCECPTTYVSHHIIVEVTVLLHTECSNHENVQYVMVRLNVVSMYSSSYNYGNKFKMYVMVTVTMVICNNSIP